MGLGQFLDRNWPVRYEFHSLGKPIDAIFAPAYGVNQDGTMSQAMTNVLQKVVHRAKQYPNADILMGTFSGGDWRLEHYLRMQYLRDRGINLERVIEIGPVSNTITEAETAKDALMMRGRGARSILMVTDELHSRTAYYVWRKTFPPEVEIRITVVPYDPNPDNEMFFIRRKWTWFIVNVGRHMLIRTFGINLMRRFRQPTGGDFRRRFRLKS